MPENISGWFTPMDKPVPVLRCISGERACIQVLFRPFKKPVFKALMQSSAKSEDLRREDVVLSLLRAKCLPVLLYGVECCPMLTRDKCTLEFTVTRAFIKLFRTGSATVINDYHIFFCLLPLTYQIDIRIC